MMENSERSSLQVRKYGIAGTAIHLAGFALGFAGQGFYQLGIVGLDSGLAVLEPIGDFLFGLGLVIIVATAARTGVGMKYILGAGTVIGLGLFYKSAIHEIHVASGIGFGLPHPIHIGIGAIMIMISVLSLAPLTFVHDRSKRQVDQR